MKAWPENELTTYHDVLPDITRALLDTANYEGLDLPNAPAALSAARRWEDAMREYRATGEVSIVSTDLLNAALFIAFNLGHRAGRDMVQLRMQIQQELARKK